MNLVSNLQKQICHSIRATYACIHFVAVCRVWLFATPWTVSRHAPLSTGFLSQEYWSGLSFPSPRDIPNPGIGPASPASPAFQADSLPLNYLGSPNMSRKCIKYWGLWGPSKLAYLFSASDQIRSDQSLSHVRLFATPWIAACQASLSITNSRSSLRLMSIESAMPPSHLILCHPLLFLNPILPSIRVFSNESTLCMRWPKYWSFSFSIIPSNEHPGLISFRMDWLDLLSVQGTLKSLLQHHSSKASILRHSAFFTYIHEHRKNHSLD